MSADVVHTGPAPRYLTRSGAERPAGAERLGQTADLLGRPLRPWQWQVADRAMGRARRWRYPLVVLTIQRQAGKTTFVAVVAVDRCLSIPGTQVWYTAQSRLDAVLRFNDMVRLLRASTLRGWWNRQAPKPADYGTWDYRVTIGAGNEAVSFPNESAIRVFAPREDSLHGSTSDLVIIDEARFFDQVTGERLLAAALPTQMTRDGQVWITSTAGGVGSTFLADQVERGRQSIGEAGSRTCYAEWSLLEIGQPGELLEAVWDAHPAAGLAGGPDRDAVELAAESMPAWQFAQEYGNLWRAGEAEGMIPGGWWAATATTGGPMGAVSFGFDVAVDRSAAAVVACGAGTVEVIRAEAGVGWLEGEVRRLVEKWDPPMVAADGYGPSAATVEALGDLGDRLVSTKTRELVAACNGFYDGLAVEQPLVAHRPHPLLDQAAGKAERRAASGSWTFARTGGGHVLVAAALAWWADRRQAALEPAEEPSVF
ncbi:MAG TPA: hypothetical protein VLL25_07590 [Acidimicrobiales bacterium]|nr:hypothetical protein [Acidimicrobiales bacterium]